MSYEKELFKLEQPHGDGEIYFAWQKGSGLYLATVGNDVSICVYNRQGKLHERIKLPGQCTGFGWDSDGDLLGMISDGSFMIMLWDANTAKRYTIETGLRDTLTVIAWSKTEPVVAVGSARGNLCIYNHRTSKRIPVLGKHSRRIVTASWGVTGLLALGSEDKTITISNNQGDTLRTVHLRFEPSALQFASLKNDDRLSPDTTISVIVGRKILFIYNLDDPDNPVELAFQGNYGNIVSYEWYADGNIVVGFSAGYFISISTKPREIGQELYQTKNHHGKLTFLCISSPLSKMATCGDNSVKIHELTSLSETTAVITMAGEEIERIAWSEDGQLLCLATASGSIAVFVSRMPHLAASHGDLTATLTSLSQVTISLVQDSGKKLETTLKTEVEPSVIGVGPYHVIVGMNNRTWVYDLAAGGLLKTSPVFLCDKQYPANVVSLSLNSEYTSALAAGRLHLQFTEKIDRTDGERDEEKESRTFPEPGETFTVTSHALTTDFLIYSSDLGDIRVFGLEDWTQLTEYKHDSAVRSCYPDTTGTRIVIIDAKMDSYMYTPMDNCLKPIPDFSESAIGVLWDQTEKDKNVFIVYDAQTISTYIYIRDTLDGTEIRKLGETKLGIDQYPLVLHNGLVILHTPGGKLANLVLSSHVPSSLKSGDNLKTNLAKHIALTRFTDALSVCMILNNKEDYTALAEAALKSLDVVFALKVYRQIGDVAMVMTLENILYVENKKLLCGHIAEVLGEFDKAEKLFLESSEPLNALIMRQNLLQWDRALKLARTLAPEEVPSISLEHATQLELIGDYGEALVHYERAMTSGEDEEHNLHCKEGICRTSLRLGDFRRGLIIANESDASNSLKFQAAVILESVKKMNEAAVLYDKSGNFDKAAAAYIGLKNWKKVGELLPKVSDPKIYRQYAKAQESDGDYLGAVESYAKSADVENVVRLCVEKLNQPQKAVNIVEQTRNIHAAKTLARHFEKLGDFSSALKFLVISRSENEALRLCKETGLVELYAALITQELGGSEEGERQLSSLALHFEQTGKMMLAAKCYFHAAQFNKALKNLIQVARGNSAEEEAIILAIEVVAAANDDVMANQLIELLLGEVDGEPRDPKFVFRLYRARKQYKEASKTAVIISNEELVNGNYSLSHQVLVGMCMELHDNGLQVTSELSSLLSLVHSYRLVRLHVKLSNHLLAARLLLRVADNISKFPAHTVPILTSTVIECHRAELKHSAFTYAAMLMKPEYKTKIENKYLKKLEGVVRKGRGADINEESSPCPHCSQSVSEFKLACNNCNNALPFCIATGKHVLKEDFTVCPNCQFPAIRSEFIRLLELGEKCPLCSSEVTLDEMRVHISFDSYYGKD
ncbi:WD repeat-containing protein 19 isoform X2 [Halyomorpha halys]|uniref:WD repeat-containing protein 19 isoform X2 n=1 Tax=Halyomorpha halys TaxID=286706 RepID=UPI0006D4E0A1|nr:WD repeat-containing protein 19 [Halyomorpha halys]